MSLKTDQRAKEILRLLLSNGKASVDELTGALHTSPASVRRDLVRLESRGLVNRTLGGAMLAGHNGAVYEPFRFDAAFQVREDRFSSEKQRIAHAAAEFVKQSETIGISAGTTTTLVARQLLQRENVNVITNAVNIGMELSSSTTLNTTLTGGTLRWAGAFSLVGPMALESLAVVVMDRLFLGATGVDARHGATLIQPEEAAVCRAMTRRARQVIVVADSSKLGRVSPAVICSPQEIDLLITDSEISEETAAGFAAAGVKVLTT